MVYYIVSGPRLYVMFRHPTYMVNPECTLNKERLCYLLIRENIERVVSFLSRKSIYRSNRELSIFGSRSRIKYGWCALCPILFILSRLKKLANSFCFFSYPQSSWYVFLSRSCSQARQTCNLFKIFLVRVCMIYKTRQANGHRTFFSIRSRTQENVETIPSFPFAFPQP
jgi:hypothetical protein